MSQWFGSVSGPSYDGDGWEGHEAKTSRCPLPVVTIDQRSRKEPEMIATTITVTATIATMLAMFAAAFVDH